MAGISSLRMQKVLSRANELVVSGKPTEAFDLYESVLPDIEQDEWKALVLLEQIGCLNAVGDTARARNILPLVRTLLPSDSPDGVHCEVAEAAIRAFGGDHEGALQILDPLERRSREVLKATYGQHLLGELQFLRFWLLVEMRRFQDAVPLIAAVESYEPKDASVYYYLGITYLMTRHSSQARDNFLRARELGVNGEWEFMTHIYLGSLDFEDGAFARAKNEFENAVAMLDAMEATTEHKVNTYSWMLRVCEALGEQDEANRFREKIAQLDRKKDHRNG